MFIVYLKSTDSGCYINSMTGEYCVSLMRATVYFNHICDVRLFLWPERVLERTLTIIK